MGNAPLPRWAARSARASLRYPLWWDSERRAPVVSSRVTERSRSSRATPDSRANAARAFACADRPGAAKPLLKSRRASWWRFVAPGEESFSAAGEEGPKARPSDSARATWREARGRAAGLRSRLPIIVTAPFDGVSGLGGRAKDAVPRGGLALPGGTARRSPWADVQGE